MPAAPEKSNNPTRHGVKSTRGKDFFIIIDPPRTTHQSGQTIMRRKDGSVFVGQNSKARRLAQKLSVLLKPHAPKIPYSGAICLTIHWQYPWRKSEPKYNRTLGVLPCITRPDADNLAKLFIDAMGKAGFFLDDSQVFDLRFLKLFADKPGIGCNITEIEPGAKGRLPIIK
tara:strand:+ start:2139 stop:2651 length:513 start_codon:yes stop_codon:yes gene_type:complete